MNDTAFYTKLAKFACMMSAVSGTLWTSLLYGAEPILLKAGVILPVIDLATAKLISAAAVKAKKTARVHFKLDTGMGRLGILAKDALAVMDEVAKLPGLDCEGVFSHCPMAYEPKDPFTKRQIALFRRIVDDAATLHGRDAFRYAAHGIAGEQAYREHPYNILARIVLHA